ncbi:MAG: hypothetical protein H0U44_02995 [Flavisolibacter sp.]|nr:hypothetical protein [Flavisolibacter sp.]
MKKQIILLVSFLMLLAVLSFTGLENDQEKDNGKGQDKGKNQDKQGKGKEGKKDKSGNQGNTGNNGNKGNQDNAGNNGNQGNNKDKKGLPGNAGNAARSVLGGKNMYNWDKESFKGRQKIRSQEKVTICHKVNSNEPSVTIRVSSNALKAHMNHGDVMGACAAVNDNRFSNIFLNRRSEYYNVVENNYEQVSYSQSVLDYALSRLGQSRQQLLVMQSNNAPASEIQQKQAAVTELEQNASLLEVLLSEAANLLVNKINN